MSDLEFVLPDTWPAPPPEAGSVFFIGTATTLIRYGGFAILTDPNFLHAGDHVHLGYGLFSRRLTEPAVAIEDLPPLDAVILSHYHGDHFDRVAERKLDKRVLVLTTHHAARRLRRRGFRNAQGLSPWESATLTKGGSAVRVTAAPAKHGPTGVAALLPPTIGTLLDFAKNAHRYRMYLSGDTLIHDRLHEIPRRFPGIDLALLHLGGTRVLGVLVTMDAEQGIEAIRIVDPRMTIPIHYNDYTVFKSPLSDFMRAVRAAGLEQRVTYLRHGDSYTFHARRLRPGVMPPTGPEAVRLPRRRAGGALRWALVGLGAAAAGAALAPRVAAALGSRRTDATRAAETEADSATFKAQA
jgi:L-ascorbate metabolism protein UlaG (beta-lactamase superfamily)